MPYTNLFAKIKKMDITNKVTADKWNQTITITLSDIELNDENLIAIRKFRPDEEVKVSLQSLQLTLEEIQEREKLQKLYPKEGELLTNKNELKDTNSENLNTDLNNEYIEDLSKDEETEGLFDIDYNEEIPDNHKVLKTFNF